jgi:hypothetical protein
MALPAKLVPDQKFAKRSKTSLRVALMIPLKMNLRESWGSSAERAPESTFKQNKFDNSSGSVSKQQFNGE